MTLLAAVVRLEALEGGEIDGGTGRSVHGLWFKHWAAVSPRTGDDLHRPRRALPFTLSPLLGLPRPQRGRTAVHAGSAAWFRVTALRSDLSRSLREEWLPRLPDELTVGELRWRVTGVDCGPGTHPWAGEVDAQELADACLLDRQPPPSLRLRFLTPVTFHGGKGHLPFPLPDALVRSWLRRWADYGPVRLPEGLGRLAREHLMVSSYHLRTVPVREEGRVTIGCVGHITLRGVRLRPGERAVFHLLAVYAFYAGSGQHTTQGMGLTRLVDGVETGP